MPDELYNAAGAMDNAALWQRYVPLVRHETDSAPDEIHDFASRVIPGIDDYSAYATDPAISRLTANSDKAAGHDRTDCLGTGAALATRPANAADAANAAH